MCCDREVFVVGVPESRAQKYEQDRGPVVDEGWGRGGHRAPFLVLISLEFFVKFTMFIDFSFVN